MKKIISIGLHLLAILILAGAFWPFCQKYLFSSHPWGNDYYVGLNYVHFIHEHLAWPPASWQNFWFAGLPTIRGYPWFHFYLVQPLVAFVGTSWAIEIYSVATFFLFFIFSYFLFWELSKNKLFSLLLTFLLLNSRGIFNALPWNGFMAGSATQMFLPLTIYLVVRFCRTKNQKLLLLAALMTGLSIMGHPITGGFFISLPSLLLLLFWKDEESSFWSSEKIGNGFIFGLVAALTASPVLYSLGSVFLNKTSSGSCMSDACWGEIPKLVKAINPLLYILAISLMVLIFALRIFGKKFNLRLSFIFLPPLLFMVSFFVAARLDLIGSLTLSIWPERVTWVMVTLLAAFLATLLGAIELENPKIALAFSLTVALIFSAAWFQDWSRKTIFLDLSSVFSGVGAYPGDNYLYATDKYRQKDIQTVLPSWLRKDEINYRLECQNYMLNFWWPLAVDVPTTRGYVHFFHKNQSYWYGWLTAGLTNFWGKGISRAKETSQNTALFLIDWNAIRFLEDSNRALKIDNPYIDFLVQEPVSDRHEGVPGADGGMSFYRLAESETSPIVKATMAKTILVVGLKENFVYDNFVHLLGAENLNSQFLIPVRGPDKLDELKKYQLTDFDAIFLNDYRYDDFSSWKMLTDYVKSGGKLFIDTGTQVRESENATLPEGQKEFPEVFPMTTSRRENLGEQWQATGNENPILAGVNFEEFGPLVYEGAPWKVSFVPQQASLRAGAEVILSQAGKPVLVSRKLGQGEVIWSGLNLTYHFAYYDKPIEAKFFKNILSYLLGEFVNSDVSSSFERKQTEKVKVTGKDFSGVVFKEFLDAGWQAKVNGEKVKIYPAGPDFMYVRVPKNAKGETKVEFYYRGTVADWFFFLLSLATIGFIVYFFIFSKGLHLNPLSTIKGKINSWWSKEGE